jgi:hypothetical protein
VRLSSPGLALVGLLAVGVVALGLLHATLTVAQAGGRIGVVLAVLVAVDRMVLPFARALVGEPARKDGAGDAAPPP